MEKEKFIYIFTGKLQPEQLIKDLKIGAIFKSKHVEFDIEGEFSVVINSCDIKVIYKTEINHTHPASANLPTLKNFVQEQIDLIVNIYCYIHSIALDAYINKVECEKLNIDYTFGIKGEHNIEKDTREEKEEFDKLFKLFSNIKNSVLKDVFSDFRKAIRYPATTAQFCYRAIETARINFYEDRGIKNDSTRRNDSWRKLREELGYNREDFREIERFATPNRHGNYPAITYQKRERIMNFTRELIDKFINIKLKQ